MKTNIEGIDINMDEHFLSLITYIPNHANGDINNENCEQGVLVNYNMFGVKMLNCKTRTVEMVDFDNLVWG